jgi:hypothetical protein
MQILEALQGLIELDLEVITLSTPIFRTRTVTDYADLPTECDGFPRKTGISTYTSVSTFTRSITQFVTAREGASFPFSPSPTKLWAAPFSPIRSMDCVIPPQECPLQWDLFLEFLRSTVPDVGEYNTAFKHLKPMFDKIPQRSGFLLRNDDLRGGGNMTGSGLLGSGLLTGSVFLDEILHIAHKNGVGVQNFFGKCEQAQKAVIKDCQIGLEKMGKKFPRDFTDMSEEEATALIIEHYGCSLQPAHARIIAFAEENSVTKRDICGWSNWGDAHTPAMPAKGEQGNTAVMSAITFPAHYDHGK